MILGLGTDIVHIERIRKAYERYGEKLILRILSPIEIERFHSYKPERKIEFLSGRFAAKEAIAKAAGCGIAKLNMPKLSVILEARGLTVEWHDRAASPSYSDLKWHVSISHTSDSALAVAICES